MAIHSGRRDLENEVPAAEPEIVCSRSFGTKVQDRETLAECLASHAARAAEKLRAGGQAAGVLSAFIRTSPCGAGPAYGNQGTVRFAATTADRRALIGAARAILNTLYRQGYA